MHNDNTQEEQSPLSSVPKKAKVKKRSKLHIFVTLFALLSTAALLFGALFVLAYRDQFTLDELERWLTYRQMETSETGVIAPFVHAGGENMTFASLPSGTVMASHSGAHYYAPSGDPYIQKITTLATPVLHSSADTAVVYDAGGQSLYLFHDQEMPFTLTLPAGNEILSARPNEDGFLAVTAQKSGYKGAVTIYNKDYQVVMEINLSSAFVMDAALSPDSKTVAVVTIGQTLGVFQSQILLYPVGEKEPSATISLGDAVVLDIDYESNQIWVVGDQALLSIGTDDNAVHSHSYGDHHLKGYTLGGDDFAALLLSEYATGDPDQLIALSPSGDSIGTIPLDSPVPSITAQGDYLSLISVHGASIYTISTAGTDHLVLYGALEDTSGAQVLSQSKNGSLLLANSQDAWIFLPTTT